MERKESRYAIKLGELSREDIECIGAKAANLSELMKIGLPIPGGFSLTTEAFQGFLDANSINPGYSAEEVEAAPLPPHEKTSPMPLMPGNTKRCWMFKAERL